MSDNQSNTADERPISENIMIEVSKDKMLGIVWFEAPQNGGARLSLDQIKAELTKKGIIGGIDTEMFEHIAVNRKYDYKYIIAKGALPQDGHDAELTLNFDPAEIKSLKPKENKDGTVDFKNLNAVHNVRKGDLLAKKTIPTEGVNGYNVLNQPLKAKKGKDVRMPKGKNTEMLEDGVTLVASLEGKLEYDGHNIYINNVYNLNGDLDSSIGNIDFIGSVVISGSIHSGFTIKAQGSVEVRGPVEDAVIIAGGDIFLSYGIQGIERGKLVSGGNVVAKFIQNATVEARKDVITEAIIHSHVSAGNSIRVESGKGTIVGGSVAATNIILAKSIGSPMGTATSVQIGILPSIYQKHKQTEILLREKQESLSKIEQSIKFLLTKSKEVKFDAQKQAMLQKLGVSRAPLMEEIQVIQEEYKELSDLVKDAQDGIIKVSDTVHPGVRLMMGTTVKYVDDTQIRCTIRKVDGDIHIGV